MQFRQCNPKKPDPRYKAGYDDYEDDNIELDLHERTIPPVIPRSLKKQRQRDWEEREDRTRKERDPRYGESGLNSNHDLHILGLTAIDGNNKQAIKKAYYRMALKWHSDKGGETEIFKKILGAYERLTGL